MTDGMVTIGELRGYRDAVRELRELRELICEEKLAMRAAGTAGGGIGGGGTPGDRLGAEISRHEARVERYTRRAAELEAERIRIEDTIAGLASPKQRRVLTLRYIRGLPRRSVAVRLGISERAVSAITLRAAEYLSGRRA